MDTETRIIELERVLEDLIECFDDTPVAVYIEVEVDGPDGTSLGWSKVTNEAAEALDNATKVLYNGDIDTDAV